MYAPPNGSDDYGPPLPSPLDASLNAPSYGATEQLGAVRIARRVLRTVVEEAALSVPGVAHMARTGNQFPRAIGRPLAHHGVALTVKQNGIAVDLYLVVEPGMNIVAVGSAVQDAVGAAIEHILGMEVHEINVYIQDVV